MLIECVLLAVVMIVWVVSLPPGSLYFQTMCRCLIALVIVSFAALFLQSISFFRFMGSVLTIGVLIGLLIRIFIYRKPPSKYFHQAMLPIVNQCEAYFTALMQSWVTDRDISPDNEAFEKVWQRIPGWVSFRGFDRFLQPRYQYFIDRMLEVGDVLFCLDYYARDALVKESAVFLRPEFEACMQAGQNLFILIINQLKLNKSSAVVDDFSEKLIHLETKLKHALPQHIEYLQDNKALIMLADVVCCLEDLRWMQVKLLEVLGLQLNKSQSAVLQG